MSAYGALRAIVVASPGAAADTQIVAAVPGKRIIVESFWAVVGVTAAHARFRSGTNEIFTGGGVAAGIPFGANGGFSIPNPGGEDASAWWFGTNVNEALNFRTEVATEIAVGVIYRLM